MTTAFTKIVNREIPAHILHEDDVCLAIMDIAPALEGQSLVMLKREVDYIFDITEEEYLHLMRIARKVARATDRVLETDKTLLIVEGFEMPHVHVKLFPVPDRTQYQINDLQNAKPGDPEELAALTEKIKAAL